MIRHIVYQKLNHIGSADTTFSVFKKELFHFLEGAGQPNEHKVCYFSHL